MEVPEFGIAIRGRQLSRSAARTGERDVIQRWKQVQDVPRNNGKGTGKRGSDRAPMRLQCFCPQDGELIDKSPCACYMRQERTSILRLWRYEILEITLYLSIGIVLVLVVTGLLIWSRRNVPVTENNKRISIAIGVLQAIHIILYFTGLLEKISQADVYIAFGICAVISMICFLLSVWILLPFSKFRHGIRYLFMVFAILQVLITIFMFLLPEGGISAPIQF